MDALWKKALADCSKLQLIFALLLFLPAWSLRFWEAWLYWLLFSAAALILTLYFLKHDPQLIERRLEAGPIAEQEKSQKIIQAIASVRFPTICPSSNDPPAPNLRAAAR